MAGLLDVATCPPRCGGTLSGTLSGNRPRHGGDRNDHGNGSINSNGIDIVSGVLDVSGGAAIGDATDVHIGAAGTLTSTANEEAIGLLSGDAGGRWNVGTTNFFAIGGTDSTFAGTLKGAPPGHSTRVVQAR